MAAWFQIDVKRCAPGFGAGSLERDDLGMVPSSDLVETGANHFSSPHQNCADHGIGTGPADSF
jgi:hypothetical protein